MFMYKNNCRACILHMALGSLIASAAPTNGQNVEAVSAAGEAVVNVGVTVAELIGNVQRRGIVEIKNFTPYELDEIKYYEYSGSVNRYPLRIPANMASVVGVAKPQGSAKGAVGVVSYRIKGTNSRLAICYSIPYDYNLYDNWFKYSIIRNSTPVNYDLYLDMYKNYGVLTSGKIAKAASGFQKWTHGEFTMSGAMTNNGQSTMRLELRSSKPSPPPPASDLYRLGERITSASQIKPSEFYTLTTAWQGPGKSLQVVNNVPQLADTDPNCTDQHWRFLAAGNGTYALTTRTLGADHSLGIIRNGDIYTLRIKQSQNVTGQMWTLTPKRKGNFGFSNSHTGPGQSIDVVNDGRNSQVWMTKTQTVGGQAWRLTKVIRK